MRAPKGWFFARSFSLSLHASASRERAHVSLALGLSRAYPAPCVRARDERESTRAKPFAPSNQNV